MKKFSILLLSTLVIAACGQTKAPRAAREVEQPPAAVMEKEAEAAEEYDAMIEDLEDAIKELMPSDEAKTAEDKAEEEEFEAMMKDLEKAMDELIPDGEAMKTEEVMEKEAMEVVKPAGGQYFAYSDGVIGNGDSAVLFFHASWCPMCKANDKNLKGFYGEGGVPLNTYKIDYDTASALKSQFGVVQQDTFVLIDGDGKPLKTISFPGKEAVRDIVNGR